MPAAIRNLYFMAGLLGMEYGADAMRRRLNGHRPAPGRFRERTRIECAAMRASRFAGVDRLYGHGSSQWLAGRQARVVGRGGVRSWAVEARARRGGGRLVLVAADGARGGSTNRQ